MSYFKQVVRDDYTPLSSGLILSKVLIVFDEQEPKGTTGN